MANQYETYKRGDCPICAGAGHTSNKSCRHTVLDDGRTKRVHCWGGGDAPDGWRYVGDDRHGMAMYIESQGNRGDGIRADHAARERRIALSRAQEEKERLGRSLTKERHEVYAKWQDSQRLNQRDRDELTRRGLLPNEIQLAQELGWLRRWERGARFSGPANIPGLTPWGLGGPSGMAIAAPNVDGLIPGFQTKPDIQGDGPKYRWLKGGKHAMGCKLRNDEMPIPVFQHPDRRGEVEVWVTEGFLKALVTALLAWRLGLTHIVVVGCGGSTWASAKGQWEYTLKRLKPKAIHLLPDAGAAQNPNILEQADKLRLLLQRLDHTLTVKWWGQFDKTGKGSLDPDEVPTQTIIDAPALPAIPTGAIQHWSQTPQRQALLVPGVGMPLLYEPGDRLQTWEWCESKRINAVDTSEAGSRKSWDAGEFLRATPAGRQRVFASQEYRNPATPTLKGFPELEAKHLGLVATEVDGETIRRHPRLGEEPNIPASCPGAEVFHRAAAKGIEYRAGAGCPTCEACSAAKITMQAGEIESLSCKHLNRKQDTKDKPAYLTHPSNIAKPSDRYDAQTVIVDEATPAIQAFTQDSFNARSIARDFADLKRIAPAIANIMEPLVDADILLLHKLSASTDNSDYWGLNSYELSQRIAQALATVEDRLDAYLAPPRFEVSPTGDKWRWLANKCDRAAFKMKSHHWGDSVEANLWAVDNLARARFFKQRLKATQSTTVVATAHRDFDDNGERAATLQLTRKNPQVRQQFAASDRTWILLDATGNPWELRRRTGQPLLWIKQRPSNFSKLTIKVVTGCDALKVLREDSAQRRAIALATAIEKLTPGQSRALIDYQRHSAAYDGLDYTMLNRYVESRGTNRAKDADVLLLMGLGITNLGQSAIEYELLTGRTVEDHSDRRFQSWVYRHSLDLAVQEIARLRAQWSESGKTVYVAGAGKATATRLAREYPGATVEIIDVMAICPMAATDKSQRTAHTVASKFAELAQEAIASGTKEIKVHQAEVAAAAGVSESTVSRVVKAIDPNGYKSFTKTFIPLLEAINSGLQVLDELPSELMGLAESLKGLGVAALGGTCSAGGLMESLESEFKRYGEAAFRQALGTLSAESRDGLLRMSQKAQRYEAFLERTATESPPPFLIPTAIA